MINKAYAAYYVDKDAVEKSSSGAMFIALSDSILKKDGIIIGGGMTI